MILVNKNLNCCGIRKVTVATASLVTAVSHFGLPPPFSGQI